MIISTDAGASPSQKGQSVSSNSVGIRVGIVPISPFGGVVTIANFRSVAPSLSIELSQMTDMPTSFPFFGVILLRFQSRSLDLR